MSPSVLRVGFLGAGTATQAIHLPTLAGLADRFRVTRVMDADPTVAEEIANRCSAVPTTNASFVIEADDVDVVAVCSPDAAHAAQVVAACRAGKRAVLCEKPLAVSTAEVRAVAAAAKAVDTLVVVGTMHAYDPGYRSVLRAWEERREQASFVRSTIVLPDNAELIAQTTQAFAVGRDRSTSGDDHPDPAALMRMLVLGLIVHDLPLIRRFRPTLGRVRLARFLPPLGYAVVAGDDDGVVELLGQLDGGAPPLWTLRVAGRSHELNLDFPPSYVPAGSARAELRSAATTSVFQSDTNGYQDQWSGLYDALVRDVDPVVPLSVAIDDILYALDLVAQLDDHFREAR